MFYANYIYGNHNLSSGITYFVPYDVFDPSPALLWLFQSDEIGVTILLLMFPFCSLILSIVMCKLNWHICRQSKRHCCDLDVYVLDGTKIRQNVLVDIKKYHFTPESEFMEENLRATLDETDVRIQGAKDLPYYEKACNHAFVTIAIVTTFVYGLALLEKIAQMQGWTVFDNTYYYMFDSFRQTWDAFFFPTFMMAFLAMFLSLCVWGTFCLGGCYWLDRRSGKLPSQNEEMISKEISDADIGIEWDNQSTTSPRIITANGTPAVKPRKGTTTEIVFNSPSVKSSKSGKSPRKFSLGGDSRKGSDSDAKKGKKGKKGRKGTTEKSPKLSVIPDSRAPRMQSIELVASNDNNLSPRNGPVAKLSVASDGTAISGTDEKGVPYLTNEGVYCNMI